METMEGQVSRSQMDYSKMDHRGLYLLVEAVMIVTGNKWLEQNTTFDATIDEENWTKNKYVPDYRNIALGGLYMLIEAAKYVSGKDWPDQSSKFGVEEFSTKEKEKPYNYEENSSIMSNSNGFIDDNIDGKEMKRNIDSNEKNNGLLVLIEAAKFVSGKDWPGYKEDKSTFLEEHDYARKEEPIFYNEMTTEIQEEVKMEQPDYSKMDQSGLLILAEAAEMVRTNNCHIKISDVQNCVTIKGCQNTTFKQRSSNCFLKENSFKPSSILESLLIGDEGKKAVVQHYMKKERDESEMSGCELECEEKKKKNNLYVKISRERTRLMSESEKAVKKENIDPEDSECDFI